MNWDVMAVDCLSHKCKLVDELLAPLKSVAKRTWREMVPRLHCTSLSGR